MAVNYGQQNQAYDYSDKTSVGGGVDNPPSYTQQGNYSMAAYPPAGQPPHGSYPQAPGYGPQATVAPTTVVVQTHQEQVVRPSSYLLLSCLVYWCCNCLFGSIAFALSLASSNAADDNNMEQARSYGRASMWVSIAGILLTALTVIIAIVVYFVWAADVAEEASDNDNYYTWN